MKPSKLKIKIKNQSYNVIIGQNLIKNFSEILSANSIDFKKCLLVVDNKVPKKFLSINKLLDILLKNTFHRTDSLISIGGGITGDVSSFAASIFKRGIKLINIPTTLLAQVDSSIGGKTGINSKYGKNLIGTFYQPNLVISDTNFLKSLPKREIICGYAEILKHSLIMNKKFFTYLNNNGHQILKLRSPYLERAIYKSCFIKKRVEGAKNYSKKLNHGEAVLLGMACASNFSYQNHKLNKIDYENIINHFKKFNLPMNIGKFFAKKDIDQILSFMQKDKKNNNNKINLVLLKKIGKTLFNLSFDNKKLHSFLKKELNN